MAIQTAPGVYLEQTSSRFVPDSIPRTDVAGFVGVAARGPLQRAVLIESSTQFTSVFGPAIDEGYLSYAVRGFFANGGRRCWVVRVADRETASCARWRVLSSDQRPAFELTARAPGGWLGRENHLRISTRRTGENRFHLALETSDGYREFYPNLSTDAEADDFFPDIINGSNEKGQSLVVVHDPRQVGSWNVADAEASVIDQGADGLASLTPQDFYQEDVNVKNGLALFAEIDELAIVAVPDAVSPQQTLRSTRTKPVRCDRLGLADPPRPRLRPLLSADSEQRPQFDAEEVFEIQHQLVQHCARQRDRFAVLDSYPPTADVESVIAWRNRFESKFAALYYPWILVPESQPQTALTRTVPPSGHVAGVYAQVSRDPGVQKPPAGELLEDTQDTLSTAAEAHHGRLNSAGINLISLREGRGIQVLGARTVSADPDWRYINVRRLVTMIEEALEDRLRWAVFEPHTQALRRDVDRVARGLLTEVWTRGMLDGADEEEAFSVTCDDTTNTTQDVELGRLVCRIVLNAPWPAEFVVINLGIGNGAIRFTESGEVDG